MAIRLVINADDFGYFDRVSEGILHAIDAGRVTATGVMANGPAFERWVPELCARPQADAGVHLNLTYGTPLTPGFPRLEGLPERAFPDKQALVRATLAGRLPLAAVEEEWRAQIAKCTAAGLRVSFLNSHEHVHMFPSLHAIAVRLAGESGVRFLRHTSADWSMTYGATSLLRSLVLKGLGMLSSPLPGTPRMLGLAGSGRLQLEYLREAFAGLRDGGGYELMCHPGFDDPQGKNDLALRDYHDWSGELKCLTGDGFGRLLNAASITLARFGDLDA